MRSAFPPALNVESVDSRCACMPEGDRAYWLIQTGVGLEKARTKCRPIFDRPVVSLMSTGFACALIPADIGTLLVGRAVVHQGTCDEGMTVCSMYRVMRGISSWLEEAGSGANWADGRLSRPIGMAVPEEKRRFALSTQATGLDMESAAVAAQAQRAQDPYCDRADGLGSVG